VAYTATYIKGMRVFVSSSATSDMDRSEKAAPFDTSIGRMPPPLVALTQFGATSMPLMRWRQTMDAAPTSRCNRRSRAYAAFLQHRAATCTHLSLKHRQQPRGL